MSLWARETAHVSAPTYDSHQTLGYVESIVLDTKSLTICWDCVGRGLEFAGRLTAPGSFVPVREANNAQSVLIGSNQILRARSVHLACSRLVIACCSWFLTGIQLQVLSQFSQTHDKKSRAIQHGSQVFSFTSPLPTGVNKACRRWIFSYRGPEASCLSSCTTMAG